MRSAPAVAPLAALALAALAACGADRSSPAPATGTVRGVCRLKGEAKSTMLDAMPAMGCDSPQDDESLREGLGHALGDCVVSIPDVVEEPVSGGATAPERRFVLVVEPCRYAPHVAVTRAPVQMVFENRGVHDVNVHAYRDTMARTKFNFTLRPGGTVDDAEAAHLDEPGLLIVKCDIFPQYLAWVHVLGNRFGAKTSPDVDTRAGTPAGGYVLEGVPPGDHEVVCWHEAVGRMFVRLEGRLIAYESGAPVRLARRLTVVAGTTVVADFDVPPR